MTRRQKDPLRALTEEERSWLERISRSQNEPASHVARAKQLLAVAAGDSYTEAARKSGRKSNDTVAQLVSRFNQDGLSAVVPQHEGGPQVKVLVYALAERKLRQKLAETGETVLNQVGKPIQTPTMRWIFQVFEGIDLLIVSQNGQVLNIKKEHLTALRLLGPPVANCYNVDF